ncbi:class I SAM-dependent methyltransferase [Deinococcus ruber]|uniref:tRNA (Adenine-N(1))-methyltransferase n=1 Tax=Deinococcus ruber TaxID=1848197 RepID=A0A918F451_9DEIO|nr:class I SAM-dependent methyltransferase [Deinococcus ruber]GGR02616.1 tRNA (adenine-N(1))-methyltransferase [Deinococcus ruber]
MPEPRLEAAIHLIRAEVHADIGSDHAELPIALLTSGRAGRVVVVEKTPPPLAVARQAIGRAGLLARAELRLGDGFAPIAPGEVHSASITGMGQRTILGILDRAAERLPAALILQPNDGAELLRQWARMQGWWLTAETLTPGFWRYPVLRLDRRAGPDPAYDGLPVRVAERFGPHLLHAAHPLLLAEMAAQQARLEPLERFGRPEVLTELHTLREALAWLTG